MQVLDLPYTRNQDSFAYACEIKKPSGVLDEIIAWCKDELVHDWRWQLTTLSGPRQLGQYTFYFDSDRDYFAFLLKWQ